MPLSLRCILTRNIAVLLGGSVARSTFHLETLTGFTACRHVALSRRRASARHSRLSNGSRSGSTGRVDFRPLASASHGRAPLPLA